MVTDRNLMPSLISSYSFILVIWEVNHVVEPGDSDSGSRYLSVRILYGSYWNVVVVVFSYRWCSLEIAEWSQMGSRVSILIPSINFYYLNFFLNFNFFPFN